MHACVSVFRLANVLLTIVCVCLRTFVASHIPVRIGISEHRTVLHCTVLYCTNRAEGEEWEEPEENEFEDFTFLDSGALHDADNSGEWNGQVGDYET